MKNRLSSDEMLNIGFLKIDVEGSACAAIRGAEELIKKYRPIVSCAIYHSPEEFFETKPLLEKITKDLNYKYEIKFLSYRTHIAIEYVLFAYPMELAQ